MSGQVLRNDTIFDHCVSDKVKVDILPLCHKCQHALVIPAVVRAADPALVPTVCLIGDHPGIPESDAQTAAMLVCDELRKQGISVTDPVYEVPASVSAYRVVLRRLGEKIIVRLSHENPTGTIVVERQMTLANIEEMIPAARDWLMHSSIASRSMLPLIWKALPNRRLANSGRYRVSPFGIWESSEPSSPGTDVAAEPGMEFGWSYETPSYAVGTEFRYSGPDDDDDANNTITLFSWSIGGRYFFNKRNISPYVGGGFAVVDASYKTKVKKRER